MKGDESAFTRGQGQVAVTTRFRRIDWPRESRGPGLSDQGGDEPYFVPTTREALAQVRDDLVGEVRSCVVELQGEVLAADAARGTVTFNGEELTYGTDWEIPDPKHVTATTPTIPRERVEGAIERWRVAQESGDFEAYSALHASTFRGVKLVGDSRATFDRAGWLRDRRQMFQRDMKVGLLFKSRTSRRQPGRTSTFFVHLMTGFAASSSELTAASGYTRACACTFKRDSATSLPFDFPTEIELWSPAFRNKCNEDTADAFSDLA